MLATGPRPLFPHYRRHLFYSPAFCRMPGRVPYKWRVSCSALLQRLLHLHLLFLVPGTSGVRSRCLPPVHKHDLYRESPGSKASDILKFNPMKEEKPPLFSTWSRMYLFVMALHALVIAVLYFFTLNYH